MAKLLKVERIDEDGSTREEVLYSGSFTKCKLALKIARHALGLEKGGTFSALKWGLQVFILLEAHDPKPPQHDMKYVIQRREVN